MPPTHEHNPNEDSPQMSLSLSLSLFIQLSQGSQSCLAEKQMGCGVTLKRAHKYFCSLSEGTRLVIIIAYTPRWPHHGHS